MTALSENIHRLHKMGYSYNKIKEELGCSKGTISYHLGDGQKEKTTTRTRDSRTTIRKYIQGVKQGQVCVDCKEDYPYWMLEFDHIADDKSFTIGKFQDITTDIEKVKLEIEKCEIVCSNCHKNRTHTRKLTTANDTLDIQQFYTKQIKENDMTYTTPGYKPDFDHDFSRGKVGENLIDTFLHSLEGGSVEVKTDYRVPETGNIYIEFEQWNRGGQPKPSGIMTSKATHWVIASPDGTGGFIVDAAWLKDLVLDGPRVFPIGQQNIVNGDTNGSSGYLVPVQYIYQKLKLLP